MKPAITTFIFDCFGVISSPVLNGWYRGNRLSRGLIDKNLQAVFKKGDLGKLTEDDILEYFLSYDGVNLTKEQLRKDIDAHLKLDGALVKTIKKLRQKGFKIALLSNAIGAFFERKVYTQYPEFKSLFDEIVISSEVGMAKPDPAIYLYTLEKIDSKPEESVFIDDSQTNIDTAAKLGMQTVLYADYSSFANFISKQGIDVGM